MKKGLFALALGTFTLGIAEFIIEGILTDVAHNMGVSIPQAGHLISIYGLRRVRRCILADIHAQVSSKKHTAVSFVAHSLGLSYCHNISKLRFVAMRPFCARSAPRSLLWYGRNSGSKDSR